MSNLPKTFGSYVLPETISKLTLGELVSMPETEIIKRGNKISFRRETEEGTTTLEFLGRNSGYMEAAVSSAPKKVYKKDYEADIREMRKGGMSQKEIAFRLGISPSYVSYILRK